MNKSITIGLFRGIAIGMFSIFLCLTASGQVTNKLTSPHRLEKTGKNTEKLGDYYTAIEHYSAYLNIMPGNSKIKYRRGLLYMKTRNYRLAEEDFLQVFRVNSEKYTEALYYAALMEMNNGNYQKAEENLNQFKSLIKKDQNLKNKYKSQLEAHLTGCKDARKILDSALNISIIRLDTSINKAHIEFSPMPLNDSTFIYASFRTDTMVYIQPSFDEDSVPYRKIYLARKRKNKWINSGLFDGPFNTQNSNTGNGVFSKDMKIFYFTRCKMNIANRVGCKIYKSKLSGTGWSEPQELDEPVNISGYTSTQPAIGIDSKTGKEVLYFVSDRPGGKGGTDIWYSVYDSRKKMFKTPRNAGSKINTKEDETTPFYDLDLHVLYFSSSGLPGLGGKDIYRSNGELGTWTQPINMGSPLNSSADDLYYTQFPNREEGLFTSNRSGGYSLVHDNCCDDIYFFRNNHYINLLTKGVVFGIEDSSVISELKSNFEITDDEASGQRYLIHEGKKIPLLEDIAVSLFLIDPQTNLEILVGVDSTDASGEYSFPLEPGKNYRVRIRNFGNFDKTLNVTTLNKTESDTLSLKPVGINVMPRKAIRIQHINYEINKSELTENSKNILDTTLLIYMQEHSDIIIEISSHTDDVGSDEYNQKLSEKRAESVSYYLQKKGINPKRLMVKGYGEKMPVADNSTEEGRNKNRRTEFRIIGSVSETNDNQNAP